MTINLSDVVDITLNGSSVVKIEDSLGTILWQAGSAPDPSTEYFYVKNLTSSANTLSIKKNDSSAPTITVYYSTDKTTWTSMGDTSTTEITYSIPANSKVYLKATTDRWGGESGNTIYTSITCSNNFGIGGNIMSLLYGDNFSGQTSFPSSSIHNFTRLFYNSTNLKNIDNLVLPATTLDGYCYQNMFQGCTGLTSIPSNLLPATTLASDCYKSMFYGCRGLTKAPELPATTLVSQCYYQMFKNCSSLNEITCYANDISASNCTKDWVNGVAATGTFYKKGSANWTTGTSGIPTGWTVIESIDPINDYFYVENLTSSANTLSIKKNDSSAPTITVYRSTNKTTWTSMGDTSTTEITYSIPSRTKVYLKAVVDNWGIRSYNNHNQIRCSGNHAFGGNIMSLLYGDNFSGQTSFPSSSTYNFTCLFWGSSKLKNIDNLVLPATTLTEGCYENIFTSCEGLTSIPSNLLPATTLAERCYQYMFQKCTGLTSIPSNLLPATTLASSCYNSMFAECTGLTSIPSNLLPATTLADSCYHAMFNICTGLTSVPSDLLPATTLASGCYRAMFSGTGLTSIPSNLLHSTTLASYCYSSMFSGTSITSIPENLLPATTLTDYCYNSMFQNCTGITTIPSNLLHSTTLASGCYSSMFKGCTGLTSVPSNLLPATTLADYCYNSMFYGCTSLTKAPDLLAYTGTSYCYSIMFSGCTSLTSARVYLNNADDTTLKPTNGMFTNISTTGILYKPIFLDHTNEWPWSKSSTSSTATGEYPSSWTIQAEIT